MANYKRKKPRTSVRCTMCTDARMGNSTHTWGVRPREMFNRATKSQRRRIAEQELRED